MEMEMWNDLKFGVRNLIRWFPIIWRDRDWDWCFLAAIMEFKLRRMSMCFKYHGHHVGNERHARQTLICAELLKRMRINDYYKQADRIFPDRGRRWADHIHVLERHDQEYLALMIKKYLRHWWD
jgi:hypothetical protein